MNLTDLTFRAKSKTIDLYMIYVNNLDTFTVVFNGIERRYI